MNAKTQILNKSKMHMSGRKGKMKKGEYKEINSKVREKSKRSASENKREMYFKKEEMLMC